MLNSDGCIHVHPMDLSKIDDILVNQLGVVIHKNPFGKKKYPYIPQGLLSVEQIDWNLGHTSVHVASMHKTFFVEWKIL